MVVLTIDAPSNEHTVYFDRPIPKPCFVSLLSRSLYNMWLNLKNSSYMSYNTKEKAFYSGFITPGHYNMETLAHYLTKSFHEKKLLTITTFNASARLIMKEPLESKALLSMKILQSFSDLKEALILTFKQLMLRVLNHQAALTCTFTAIWWMQKTICIMANRATFWLVFKYLESPKKEFITLCILSQSVFQSRRASPLQFMSAALH